MALTAYDAGSSDLLDRSAFLPMLRPPVLNVRSLLRHRLRSLLLRHWPRITLVALPTRRKRVVLSLPSQRQTHAHPPYRLLRSQAQDRWMSQTFPLPYSGILAVLAVRVIRSREIGPYFPFALLPPSSVSVAAPTRRALLAVPEDTASTPPRSAAGGPSGTPRRPSPRRLRPRAAGQSPGRAHAGIR
jgi:hypothetical protein